MLNLLTVLDHGARTGDFEPDPQADQGGEREASVEIELFEMPQSPGERRYYRRSSTEGWEVLLLQRVSGSRWLVAMPDLGVVPLMLNHRKSVATHPVNAVTYTALPVLSDQQKVVLYAKAAATISGGTIGRDLPLYQPGEGVRRAVAAQALLGLVGLPGRLRALARWGLRSRSRAAGMIILGFLCYEALDILGIFRVWDEWRVGFHGAVEGLKLWLNDVNDTTREWVETIETVYDWMTSVMSLRRWSLLAVASMLFAWSWNVEGDDESDGSSAAASDTASSAASDRDPGMSAPVVSMLMTTNSAISDLIASNKAMRAELEDMRTAQRAAELRRDARAEETESSMKKVLSASPPDQGSGVDQMMQRLEAFEEMLKSHLGSAAITAEEHEVPQKRLVQSASAGDLVQGQPVISDPLTFKELNTDLTQNEGVRQAIMKMKLKAQLPQQLFLVQLEDYKEVDKELWEAQFPIGYRERMAATFLSEVFSTGKTGEQWARDYVRDHGVRECHASRELIAAMSALDAMLMVDRERGLLNRISVERLSRKAYALTRAFRNCQTEADWRKPKNADKAWRSKLDWESARRIDPLLGSEQEGAISIPKVDEEVRKEMDREATILKARAKLDERGGQHKDPEF